MLKTNKYPNAILAVLAITALIIGESTIFPVWAAAQDGQEDICTNPEVILCDNFEGRALGSGDLKRATYKNNGWDMSDMSNFTVNDDQTGVYRGNHALQIRYPARGGGVGFMTVNWSSERELYMRIYQKWSSKFKWSPIATKGFSSLTPKQSMYFWWNNWGGGDLSHWANPIVVEYNANVNGKRFILNLDQWYCLEIHFKYNAGASDGIVEGWIDGVKRYNYQNVALDKPGTKMTGLLLSGYWNCVRGPADNFACDQPKDQHPLMYRWLDNFVVSKQRIGCLGPTAPTGLKIQ